MAATLLLAVMLVALVSRAAPVRAATAAPLLRLGTDGFYNSGGQRVWLRGFDTSGDGIPDPISYQQFSSLGANFARLVVYWDELEPNAPIGGVHVWNTYRLSQIDAEVQNLASQGVYVLVDFHMWKWSPYFDVQCSCQAHGIPDWEVSPGGYPQTKNGVLQAEADWLFNQQGQANYNAFVQMMVNRYEAFPNVIAYELFNEPQWGSLPSNHATTQLVINWEAKIAQTIRATGTQRAIAFQIRGGGDLGIQAVDLSPFGSMNNMLLDFHDYFTGHPGMGFTPDGENWSPSWDATHVQTETAYTGTLAMQQSVLAYAVAQAARLHLPMFVGEWGNMNTSANLSTYQQQLLTLLNSYHLDWTRWALSRNSAWSVLSNNYQGTPLPAALQIKQAIGAALPPPKNLTLPAITGNPMVGRLVNVSTGTWTPTGLTFSYQWQRCTTSCSPIAGATTSTYKVVQADAGTTVQATVTGTNTTGSTTATAAGVQIPLNGTAPANTVLPVIGGRVAVGLNLTVSRGTWTGTLPMSWGFQWARCTTSCTPIAGAKTATYKVVAADVGASLKATVTATNLVGSASATSPGVPVGSGSTKTPPANTALPAISGSPVVGRTLTASTGSWTGTTPLSYAYQWQRCTSSCASISGAAHATYALVAADAGTNVQVTVTASNAAGSASATSASVPVGSTATAPANTSLPAITGSGERMWQATTGTWSGAMPLGYAYQWLRCDAAGANCLTIPGATHATYLTVAADKGHTIRARVTATNGAGTATATSLQSRLL